MKQKLLQSLMLIAALLTCTHAFAHDFEAQNSDGVTIYYNIISSTDKTCKVTYRGSSSNSYSNEYTGSITIPETVTYNGTTYSVTSIGYGAFYGCTGLTSVTIPNSVTSIGNEAFYGCTGLTSITIPNSVVSIGGRAFLYCTSLATVTIPNSVTSIGSYAFRNCTGLTSITIPNSVTSIGSWAFFNCSGLTSIIIPEGVTSIGESAFYRCTGLTSVSIGNSVTNIGDYAFYGNYNILTIACKAKTPPTCGTNVFYSVIVKSVPLTVPIESVSLYQTADTWLDFYITGAEFSGIEEKLVDDNENTTAVYYNLQGVRVENPERGLYIKRQGGKTTKVIL